VPACNSGSGDSSGFSKAATAKKYLHLFFEGREKALIDVLQWSNAWVQCDEIDWWQWTGGNRAATKTETASASAELAAVMAAAK